MRPPENGVVDRARYPAVTVGEGYAVGSIDDLEQGYGFSQSQARPRRQRAGAARGI